MDELTSVIKFVSDGGASAGGTTGSVATGDIRMFVVGIIVLLVGGFAILATASYRKRSIEGAHVSSSSSSMNLMSMFAAFIVVTLGLGLTIAGSANIKAYAENSSNLTCNDVVATVNESTGEVTIPAATLKNLTERDYSFVGFKLQSVDGVDVSSATWTIKLDDVTIFEGKAGGDYTIGNFSILESGSSHNISISQTGLTADSAKSLINKTIATMVFDNVASSLVSLDANGGVEGTITSVSAWYGFDMPAIQTAGLPSLTGYKFLGYFDDKTDGTQYYNADGTSALAWNKVEDTTLYAHWSPETYTITYKDENDATFSGTHTDGYATSHTYGTDTVLDKPTKTDYTFDGYFTTVDCSGDAVTTLGATEYTSNIVLYAKWSPAAADCKIDISGNKEWITFDKTALTVKSGVTVSCSFDNTSATRTAKLTFSDGQTLTASWNHDEYIDYTWQYLDARWTEGPGGVTWSPADCSEIYTVTCDLDCECFVAQVY